VNEPCVDVEELWLADEAARRECRIRRPRIGI
jgi:hypothetical protein